MRVIVIAHAANYDSAAFVVGCLLGLGYLAYPLIHVPDFELECDMPTVVIRLECSVCSDIKIENDGPTIAYWSSREPKPEGYEGFTDLLQVYEFLRQYEQIMGGSEDGN
jgi:hypothetical protein